jgi:hypothetical protein
LRKIIPLADIKPDILDRPHLIKGYVALLLEGRPAPEIWVHEIRQPHRFKYFLIEGKHRCEAARLCGHTHIAAKIFPGEIEWINGREYISRI